MWKQWIICIAAGPFFAALASAYLENGNATSLMGTWSSKSNKVFTGPGFYNPVTDRLIEPELTGISYSFTDNGYFEEALYFVLPNRKYIRARLSN